MKKTLTFAAALFLSASAHAGHRDLTMVPSPTTASCFNGTELQLDGFGIAHIGDDDNTYGGGVGLNYFVSAFLGFGAEAYWIRPDDSVANNISGSAILRMPIEAACAAVYAFGGVGVHADSENVGTLHAGIGFEWRPTGPSGYAIFSDVRYTWADEDAGVEDAPQIRLGLRAIF